MSVKFALVRVSGERVPLGGVRRDCGCHSGRFWLLALCFQSEIIGNRFACRGTCATADGGWRRRPAKAGNGKESGFLRCVSAAAGSRSVAAGATVSSWIPVLGSSRICSRSCSRAGKSISTSELIDLIWGDRAPSSALNILQKYVCALRRLLDPPQWGIAYHWALLAEMWLAAGSHEQAEAVLDRAVRTMRDYGLRYAEPPPNDSSQDRGPCLTAGPEGQSGQGMRSGDAT